MVFGSQHAAVSPPRHSSTYIHSAEPLLNSQLTGTRLFIGVGYYYY